VQERVVARCGCRILQGCIIRALDTQQEWPVGGHARQEQLKHLVVRMK
jgi:hypothetical protein